LSPFRSSTGLPEQVAAFLCHLLPFIGGIVFLIIEKRSRFGSLMVGHTVFGFLPLLGLVLTPLLTITGVLLWGALLIASLQRKWLKLPWLGNFAEQQIRGW
jgi:uncharacterized membrane protein